LSKFFNDEWLEENKLVMKVEPTHSINDLLKQRGLRELVTVTPDMNVAAIIELMQTRGISQLPVLEDGKPVGSVQEVTIARVLHDYGDPRKLKIGEIMARPLPTLDVGTQLDEAYRMLMAGHTGVLATSGGRVVDILTRIDLVQYWNSAKKYLFSKSPQDRH
jgi:cystathionine beta-synthase